MKPTLMLQKHDLDTSCTASKHKIVIASHQPGQKANLWNQQGELLMTKLDIPGKQGRTNGTVLRIKWKHNNF